MSTLEEDKNTKYPSPYRKSVSMGCSPFIDAAWARDGRLRGVHCIGKLRVGI